MDIKEVVEGLDHQTTEGIEPGSVRVYDNVYLRRCTVDFLPIIITLLNYVNMLRELFPFIFLIRGCKAEDIQYLQFEDTVDRINTVLRFVPIEHILAYDMRNRAFRLKNYATVHVRGNVVTLSWVEIFGLRMTRNHDNIILTDNIDEYRSLYEQVQQNYNTVKASVYGMYYYNFM